MIKKNWVCPQPCGARSGSGAALQVLPRIGINAARGAGSYLCIIVFCLTANKVRRHLVSGLGTSNDDTVGKVYPPYFCYILISIVPKHYTYCIDVV
jgi:hypothetical protein